MKKIILCLLSFLISLSVYSQDIEKLKRKAEAGNDKAKIDLSVYYIHEGTESDKRKVYTMLKDIYISNQVYKNKRDYCLGICYYWGWGVKKDYLRAFGIFEGLCILGFDNFFPDVEYYKGECYYNGYGTPESKGAAYIAFYHSALHGSALSRLALGRMVHDGHQNPDDLEHIFNWIREEVEDKQCTLPIAQYYLGYLYQNGLGTQKNEAKAIEWYKKSTDPLAKKQLAVLEDQMRILQEALPKPEGANMEVRLLYSFEGGSQCVLVNSSGEVMAEYNIKEEKLKSYHDKDNDAMRFACYFYKTTNKEILNSKRKAFKLFLELALNNNSQAQYMVGRMYHIGQGTNKNVDEAINWYRRSNEAGAKKLLALLEKKVSRNAKSQEKKEKRLALIVGNSDYNEQLGLNPLSSPKNDAMDISAKLKTLGFDLMPTRVNLSRDSMEAVVERFCEKSKDYDVVLFYYSGHAVQYEGNSLLLPIGQRFKEDSDYRNYSINIDDIMHKIEGDENRQARIFIVDACRDSFNSGYKGNVDIKDFSEPKRSHHHYYFAYATQLFEKAEDGKIRGLRNSTYTQVLLDNLDTPDITIDELFSKVRETVYYMSDMKQVPVHHNNLPVPLTKFYFNKTK